MPEAIEVKDQLDALIKGVSDLNEKHAEFEEKTTSSTAKTTEEIENLKSEIMKTVDAMQKQKQEDAALMQKQKEDFELLQKTIIANGGGGDEGFKSAVKEYENHFARFLKKGTPVPEDDMNRIYLDIAQKSMFGVDDERIEREAKDLVAGSNADGGFFLTADRSSTMSTRMFETSPIRPIANVQTTTSDVWEIILDDDEPDAGWVGEVDSRPDTDSAQVGLIKIPVHELYSQPRATQKMIDDAGFDIAAWHQGKVTRKFARLENTAFVSGDGSAEPKGFLSYSAWSSAGTYQRNAVEQVTTATATTIAGDDLLGLQGSLVEDYQPGAQWAMNRKTFYEDILTLKGSDGQYLINPTILRDGGQLVVLGKPVNLFTDIPVVANNSLSVVYADWQEFYTIVDRMGIRVLRDPYTAKPYIRFYTTKRVGGAVTNYEAGKILKVKSA